MKSLVSLAAVIGIAAALSACTTTTAPPPPAATPVAAPAPAPDPNSLYARLGGRPAIAAVMDDFVNRMARDKRIAKRFAKTDAAALKAKLTDQVCQASGGPCKYTGKDMKTVHAGMKITNAEWNITGAHIQAAMRTKKVKPREQREVLALLGTMKGDIVGQ